jgi:thiol-disulfide isomerase/thioredoxin
MWMRVLRSILLTICVGFLGAVGAYAQASAQGVLHRPVVNTPAPGFGRMDLAGREVRLGDYRGKVVLLNFWATWCASCRVELPRFGKWQKKYGSQGLQVVAVSMDDNSAPVRKTARKLGLGFPIVMGDAKLGESYGGVLGLPVTYLVDRHGVIVERFDGATDLRAMEVAVKKALARE